MTIVREPETHHATGWYVYGITSAGALEPDGMSGIGTLAAPVQLVTADGLAAVISEVDVVTLGSPEDLVAHQRLVDGIARDATILPFRFGAIMSSRTAVTDELLLPYRDEFAAALDELAGLTEYLVRARYVEDDVLRDICGEAPEVPRLLAQVRELPEEASWQQRIELGEIIATAVGARRSADTEYLVDELAPYCVAITDREPTHEMDAANVAVLVNVAAEHELRAAVDRVTRGWAGRIELRVAGPLAPYDFVLALTEPELAGED